MRKDKKIKDIQLRLLDEFIDVCEHNNLKWCVAYGTLLGAVREGDMIPWDYDIDVFMPLNDYNKLWDLYDNKEIFQGDIYLDKFNGSNYYTAVSKLKHKNTTAICKGHIRKNCNIFIDIYPVISFQRSHENLQKICEIGNKFKVE